MSASAIFILDLKGKVLICRNYMGNMDMAEIDHFMPILMKKEEDADVSPLLTRGAAHFLWIKHSNLYLVAMTKKNANAALVYSFLYKIVEVFKEYFKELEEESIRDNFVTVYELMDEVMDFGFPQTTDSKILQDGHKPCPVALGHRKSLVRSPGGHAPYARETKRSFVAEKPLAHAEILRTCIEPRAERGWDERAEEEKQGVGPLAPSPGSDSPKPDRYLCGCRHQGETLSPQHRNQAAYLHSKTWYITQQGHKLEVGAPRPPATVTNAVSWRSEGIKYRKNEVFMDVIESVNLLVSANGSVLRSEIVGSIKLKVVLSGMPELRLGLNDKVLFEITGTGRCLGVIPAQGYGAHMKVPPPLPPPEALRKGGRKKVRPLRLQPSGRPLISADRALCIGPPPADFKNTGASFNLWEKSKTVELEDVKFHQCVRLSRFENDRTISFIPPDGECELMSYRLNTTVKPLFWIESVIEKYSHSRVEIKVKDERSLSRLRSLSGMIRSRDGSESLARSQFKSRSTANNVSIMVPVPSDADSPKFKTSMGSAKWVPEKNAVQWNIKSFPGGKEYMMRAHFGLPSVESDELEGKPPITVSFEIPYFTVSGIQVRYLKIIEKSGYQALPWVRYITQSGGEFHRTGTFQQHLCTKKSIFP
ncbi:hypothetical protein JZ751_024903 [Albula glossodonta]|uniref:MHD domain-containing protein n=1 Tax=Albula glossodonta TaxID=121402 RepID=A0A8T2PEQ9_9TELE|nr:hypothetical protein JZ751_024903 [Albula glossodonta]